MIKIKNLFKVFWTFLIFLLAISQSYSQTCDTYELLVEDSSAYSVARIQMKDGILESISFFDSGTIIDRYEYYQTGGLKSICHFRGSQLPRICAKCGDLYMGLNVMINDSIPFEGNKWYVNGFPEVICTADTSNQNIVHFQYYNDKGQTLQTGSFKYLEGQDFDCWKPTGSWCYYVNGRIAKQTAY